MRHSLTRVTLAITGAIIISPVLGTDSAAGCCPAAMAAVGN